MTSSLEALHRLAVLSRKKQKKRQELLDFSSEAAFREMIDEARLPSLTLLNPITLYNSITLTL